MTSPKVSTFYLEPSAVEQLMNYVQRMDHAYISGGLLKQVSVIVKRTNIHSYYDKKEMHKE